MEIAGRTDMEAVAEASHGRPRVAGVNRMSGPLPPDVPNRVFYLRGGTARDQAGTGRGVRTGTR